MTIYEEMKEAGIEIDHHESDLYVPVNDKTKGIISRYKWKCNVKAFRSAIDNTAWYDIPFAFDPFWPKICTDKATKEARE